jgi:hypothetical protein
MPPSPFEYEAESLIREEVPDLDPDWMPASYEAVKKIALAYLEKSAEAHELRARLARCEATTLPIQQALSMVGTHAEDMCPTWPTAPRVQQLLQSVITELIHAEQGSPNAEQFDTGPTAVSYLAEARGHLQVAGAFATDGSPVRPALAMGIDLIDLAMQEVEQAHQHLQQIRRQVSGE